MLFPPHPATSGRGRDAAVSLASPWLASWPLVLACVAALAGLAEAEAELLQGRGEPSGLLRVALPPLLGRAMLADAGESKPAFAAYEGAIDYRRAKFVDEPLFAELARLFGCSHDDLQVLAFACALQEHPDLREAVDEPDAIAARDADVLQGLGKAIDAMVAMRRIQDELGLAVRVPQHGETVSW